MPIIEIDPNAPRYPGMRFPGNESLSDPDLPSSDSALGEMLEDIEEDEEERPPVSPAPVVRAEEDESGPVPLSERLVEMKPGQYPGMRLPLGKGLPPPAPPVSINETLNAAFRQENLIVSAIEALRPDFWKREPDHNPLDLIKDTHYEEFYLDNFVGSRSEEHTRQIMSKIDRELKDREILAAAGVPGLAMGVIAGTLDPTIFLPFGTFGKAARAATRLGAAGRGAGRGMAVTAGAASAQELGLHATQEVRPWEDAAVGIATATVLGGIIG